MGLSQLQNFAKTYVNYILIGIVVLILIILLFNYNANTNTNNAPFSDQPAPVTNQIASNQSFPVINQPQTASNIENIPSHTSLELVLFYASWCGHCSAFMPVWDECVKKLSNYPVKFTKIECIDTEKRCAGVPGFPTIRFFKDGKVEEYRGPRTINDIEIFLKGRI